MMCGECNWPVIKIPMGEPGEILVSVDEVYKFVPMVENKLIEADLDHIKAIP